MAMVNLLFKTSPIITAPQTSRRTFSRSKTSFYTPPTSSLAAPLSHPLLSMHAVEPVSALVKENAGFGGNMSWGESFGSNSSSFRNYAEQTDQKFQCQWGKEGTIAETKDDTRSTETKIHKSKRRLRTKPRRRLYAVIVGASFCVVLAIASFTLPKHHRASRRTAAVPYSDLVGGIRDGTVVRVQFIENSRRIFFNTKSAAATAVTPPGSHKPKWQYHTRNVYDDKHGLLRMLKEKGVTYGSDPTLFSGSAKSFLLVLLQLAPYWIMVLLSCYQLNVQLNLGRTKKRKPSKKVSVTFDDVEGVDAAKAELLEIVMCIKGDGNYTKLGAKLPRGVLLAGPPGTGKTLLARAVAGEAGVSFFSISASELVEVFVGTGAARVRDLFQEARKNSPAVIFIDEIDAVGGQRGRTLNCERDQTLNQLLTDMDGFHKDAGVVVMAATNRPETLDSALLRPGRFSRKVAVGEPDADGRKKIFALYLRDVPMAEDDKAAVCDLVASRTPGLVGADLENIAHESVLLAARRGGDFVTRDDVVQAVERATAKICEPEPEPFPSYGPMAAQERVQFGGGSMGFGFPN